MTGSSAELDSNRGLFRCTALMCSVTEAAVRTTNHSWRFGMTPAITCDAFCDACFMTDSFFEPSEISCQGCHVGQTNYVHLG